MGEISSLPALVASRAINLFAGLLHQVGRDLSMATGGVGMHSAVRLLHNLLHIYLFTKVYDAEATARKQVKFLGSASSLGRA